MKKEYGFIAPVIEPDHYVLGVGLLPTEVLQADRNWKPFLVKQESQLGPFGDTFNCSAFGSLNPIEILHRRLFGVEINWSDRGLGIAAGTYPPGNDPHVVCETIRKVGVVKEESLPFDATCTTVDKYYSPKPLPAALLAECAGFVRDYRYNHEWVFSDRKTPLADKQRLLMEALQYSPLSVAVVGWKSRANGLFYKSIGELDNHWVTLINVVEGQYWEVFDHVDQYVKRLEWDYDFGYSKRHVLRKNDTTEAKQVNLLSTILEWLKDLLGIVQSAPVVPPAPPTAPVAVPTPPTPPIASKYLWDTKANVRHSLRVICDEEGLSASEKNLICAVIQAESGFDTKVIRHNDDARGSFDYGLCQYNSYWYVSKGLITKDQALNDPEFCVRLMIKQFRDGRIGDWVAYSSGIYKKYL